MINDNESKYFLLLKIAFFFFRGLKVHFSTKYAIKNFLLITSYMLLSNYLINVTENITHTIMEWHAKDKK